jgi:hypothetical protein
MNISETFWSVMECYSWLCFGVGYLVTTLVLLYVAFLLFDATAWTVVHFIYFRPRRHELVYPRGFFRYWFLATPMWTADEFFSRLWGSSSGVSSVSNCDYSYTPPFDVRKAC